MKNYIVLLFVVLSGALLMTNCSDTVKVGFLMDESQTGRWETDKNIFIKSIEAEGGEVVFGSAEMDAVKQYELAVEMLAQGVDVLVVVPTDMYEAAKIVVLAHKQGVRPYSR